MEDLADVISMIKSCVISKKGGVPLAEINRDYKSEVGSHIPYRKFGFNTLDSFLKSLKEVHVRSDRNGNETLHAVIDEKTAHIAALVGKQKDPSKKKRKKNKYGLYKKGYSNYNFATSRTTRPLGYSSQQRSSPTSYSRTSPSYASPQRSYSIQSRLVPSKNNNQDGNNNVPAIKKNPIQTQKYSSDNKNTDVRGMPFVVVNSADNKREEKVKDVTVEKKVAKDKENVQTTLKVTTKNYGQRQVQRVEPLTRMQLRNELLSDDYCEYDCCPSVAGYTLFGDDFFLGYASKYLDYTATRLNGRLSVGMCRERMSLLEAQEVLHSRRCFPRKVVLLLGATDIVAGLRFQDIARDLYTLINDLLELVEHIVVCTIPPLFVANQRNPFQRVLTMNELIKCIPEDLKGRVKIIDLYDSMTESKDANSVLKLYSHDMGTTRVNSPVDWNTKGHKFINKILIQNLAE